MVGQPVEQSDELPQLPLAGFTVGVTADRRGQELVDLLRRKGSTVIHGPAMRTVPIVDNQQLRAATDDVIARPPRYVVITTGVGFRGWLDAARSWGSAAALHEVLANARILVRGPKAKGAVRAAGLIEAWSASSETVAELRRYLLAESIAGQRVVLQQHGKPLPGLASALRDAGAEVIELAVYRWAPPEDFRPLDALLDAIIAGDVHALTFTSAPAVDGMLRRAADTGRSTALTGVLRERVLLACVGSVTAEPLVRQGFSVIEPARARTAALVRLLVEQLPRTGVTRTI
ncbi:MAG: uroporphyrinogen-III synthase [Sciscionella sp.]|nr:uroporphyrinogen-III synthase [Sciscionella sp.]